MLTSLGNDIKSLFVCVIKLWKVTSNETEWVKQ